MVYLYGEDNSIIFEGDQTRGTDLGKGCQKGMIVIYLGFQPNAVE